LAPFAAAAGFFMSTATSGASVFFLAAEAVFVAADEDLEAVDFG